MELIPSNETRIIRGNVSATFERNPAMTTIDVERRGAVALVTINNPARKNAVTLEMRQALLETFRGFVTDYEVRAVVLTGAGEAFCSGADVSAMGGRDIAAARARMRTMHAMIR